MIRDHTAASPFLHSNSNRTYTRASTQVPNTDLPLTFPISALPLYYMSDDFTDYTFSESEFNGLVRDPSRRVVYGLAEETTYLGGFKGITVTRGDGSLVGELRRENVFGGPTWMTINGTRIDKIFTKSRERFLSPIHYNFMDDHGNHFYWKNTTARTLPI